MTTIKISDEVIDKDHMRKDKNKKVKTSRKKQETQGKERDKDYSINIDNNKAEDIKNGKKRISHDTVIACFVTAVVAFASSYYTTSMKIGADISAMQEKNSNIQSSVDKIEAKIDNLVISDTKNSTNVEAMQKEIDHLYNYVSINVICLDQGWLGKTLIYQSNAPQKVYSLGAYSQNDKVGVIKGSGEEIFAEELRGKKNILYYEEDDYTVVFYGAYNEDYHWDGNCLINTYKNGILIYISYAIYDDGKLLSSIDVYSGENKSDCPIWNIYYKQNYTGYNCGDIYSYEYHEVENELDLEKLSVSDLVYPEQFRESNGEEVLSVYHGQTKDGNWNDTTGTSYYVKYDSNGCVTLLYVGDFADGQFNDSEALEIVFDSTQNKYFYYKGAFIKGNRKKEDNHYISKEEIDNMISDVFISQDLKWNYGDL